MSLYTFSHSDKLTPVKMPAGLGMEGTTDIVMLSIIGNSTIEDVTERLANDNKALVAYINNLPAAFGLCCLV